MSGAIAITPAIENCNSLRSLRFEQIQIDRFAHLKIPERRWMNAIAAIVSYVQEIGIRGAAHNVVKIDNGIEGATLSNPSVDLIAHFRFRVVPAGIPSNWRNVVARHDGDADDFKPRALTRVAMSFKPLITCSALASRRISLVPMNTTTCDTPAWANTSRSSRSVPGVLSGRGATFRVTVFPQCLR